MYFVSGGTRMNIKKRTIKAEEYTTHMYTCKSFCSDVMLFPCSKSEKETDFFSSCVTRFPSIDNDSDEIAVRIRYMLKDLCK